LLRRRLAEPGNALLPPLADRLRRVFERRRNAVRERLGGVGELTGESADAMYRRLVRETIGAERKVIVLKQLFRKLGAPNVRRESATWLTTG